MSRDTASLLGWMAFVTAGWTVAAQQPTFRSGVDLVTVDAAVHDADGRPLSSLRAEDFRMEVDGRPGQLPLHNLFRWTPRKPHWRPPRDPFQFQ